VESDALWLYVVDNTVTRGDSEDDKEHNITCGVTRQKTHAQKISVAAVSQ